MVPFKLIQKDSAAEELVTNLLINSNMLWCVAFALEQKACNVLSVMWHVWFFLKSRRVETNLITILVNVETMIINGGNCQENITLNDFKIMIGYQIIAGAGYIIIILHYNRFCCTQVGFFFTNVQDFPRHKYSQFTPKKPNACSRLHLTC